MIENNFIRDLIVRVGMDADGAMIGAIGAIVSTIGKVNGISWKKAVFLIIGGLCISGYLVPALRESTELGNGITFFMVFLIGAVSQHVYDFLDNFAPTIFKMIGEYIKSWINKKIK